MQLSIDFGMCFSKAAIVLDGSSPIMVKDPNQETGSHRAYMIPSSVYIKEGGEVVVGWGADQLRAQDPQRYQQYFKWHLDQGSAPLKIAGQDRYCWELVASLLKQFKEWA